MARRRGGLRRRWSGPTPSRQTRHSSSTLDVYDTRRTVLAEAKEVRQHLSTWRARPHTHAWTTTTRSRSSTPPAARSARSPRRWSCHTSASTRSSKGRPGRPGPPRGPRRRWKPVATAAATAGTSSPASTTPPRRSWSPRRRRPTRCKHNYIGTEHLMLAIVKRGIEGVDVLRRRARAGRRAGRRGRRALDRGLPRPFTPRAKRVLEAALNDAVERRPRAVRPGRHPAGDRVRLARASAARSFATSASHPSSCARSPLASRRGRVAAAVQLDEQGRGACGRLGEQDAGPGVAAPTAPSVAFAASAASSAASAASSAIRSGSSIVRARASSDRVARNSR